MTATRRWSDHPLTTSLLERPASSDLPAPPEGRFGDLENVRTLRIHDSSHVAPQWRRNADIPARLEPPVLRTAGLGVDDEHFADSHRLVERQLQVRAVVIAQRFQNEIRSAKKRRLLVTDPPTGIPWENHGPVRTALILLPPLFAIGKVDRDPDGAAAPVAHDFRVDPIDAPGDVLVPRSRIRQVPHSVPALVTATRSGGAA